MYAHPLDLPTGITAGAIPIIYLLGLTTGNVSWVDRLWPFHPVICSGCVVWWAKQHSATQASLPRLACMLGLQLVWSARLTRHAIRRGFYDLTGQDYRYTQFKKVVPGWFFQLIHLLAVAIAQPALLLSLSLPLYSVLKTSSSPAAGALNIYDFSIVLSGLTLVGIEHVSDNAMYEYQNAKHGSESTDVIHPPKTTSMTNGPSPAAYPRAYHPGFITTSLFKYVRHPNFAAEQLFWFNQALFAVNAGFASGLPKSDWMKFGLIFAPSFSLSLLFCGSTLLTEWITSGKYPVYRNYKRLVGQFLPQETLFVRLWAMLRGTTEKDEREVFNVPKK